MRARETTAFTPSIGFKLADRAIREIALVAQVGFSTSSVRYNKRVSAEVVIWRLGVRFKFNYGLT